VPILIDDAIIFLKDAVVTAEIMAPVPAPDATIIFKVTAMGAFGVDFHPYMASILLSATTNGVLRCLSIPKLSNVCLSIPCIISTTKMAISHKLDPLVRRLVNDS